MATMELKCQLSADEVRDTKDNLIKLMWELRDVEENKRKDIQAANATIKDLRNRIDDLLEQANTHFVMRDVPVREEPDYPRNEMKIIRTDTDAVIQTRQLADEERQDGLPGVAPSSSSSQEAPAPA